MVNNRNPPRAILSATVSILQHSVNKQSSTVFFEFLIEIKLLRDFRGFGFFAAQ